MKASLFGTDGIRGRVNEYPITVEMAQKVAKHLIFMLKTWDEKPCYRILIARDTRASGIMLEHAMVSGLISMGAEVYILGVVPTPALAYVAKSVQADASIMLTASHNPFEDNGIKIFGKGGYKLSDEQEQAFNDQILEVSPAFIAPVAAPIHLLGTAHQDHIAIGRYIEAVKQSVNHVSLKGLKMVIDCGNGAASQVAPLIFKELGADVICIHNTPNGNNINEQCGALFPEVAGAVVREHQADLGISLDGDADRVIFCDSQGNPISGDAILGLAALALKEEGKLSQNTLVVTSMSNAGLLQYMQEQGIEVKVSDVGDRNVLHLMQSGGYSFGGENSGHLIFHEFATTGDGIMSALQIVHLMQKKQTSLAMLARAIPQFPSQLINLPVKEKKPLETLPHLQSLLQECSNAFGSKGRHLIRYSGTERKIRILLEHQDEAEIKQWLPRFQQVIETELNSL